MAFENNTLLGVQAGNGPFTEGNLVSEGLTFGNTPPPFLGEKANLDQAFQFNTGLSESITKQLGDMGEKFMPAPAHNIMNAGAPQPHELQGLQLGDQYSITGSIGASNTPGHAKDGGWGMGSGNSR